ncbi:efflux RND transporter periplasmic adaptor subunit [Chondromyces crocatus]|uniref:Cation efflux system protein CzcB n=1 Tax=Chondromyces crocatus TaxID=52 RepID=A0A0K1ENA6_CHOCO|nr:efflux RND transporter periplasmic adaptor subunit [Chondromyces crocatus]AKT42415.1 cation efflux system protein CzcB [Chondromyces crocatus]
MNRRTSHRNASADSARRRATRHRIAGVLLVAAQSLVLGACAKSSADATPAAYALEQDGVRMKPGAPQPVRFETTEAEMGAPLVPPPVTARITTVETLTAPSFAPLEGRVVEIRARLGDQVKQGDKLVLVRTADLASLQHELQAASLAIRTKQAVVDRLEKLAETRAASQNDLLVAQSELAEAKLAAHAAGARIRSLSVSQQGDTMYWVLATRSGTIVELNATPGSEVGPNRDRPIVTVADLDQVLALGDLSQNSTMPLAAGMTARITIPGRGDTVVLGKVETVSEVVDPSRQTVPIRVLVENKNRTLRPNAYVDLTFEPQDQTAIVQVPAAAVVSDGALSVVFVEHESGVLKRREVRLGRQGRDKVEVVAGLSAGERVVTTGALLLLNALNIEG